MRLLTAAALALGLIWALALVWVPRQLDLPFIPAPIAVPGAMMAPGIMMIVMVAVLGLRRLVLGHAADTDRQVVQDSAVHLVLALVIWPFVANSLGGAVVLAMGFSFPVARLLYWIGAYRGRPLMVLGFAASFFPTAVAALWSVLFWVG